MLTSRTPRLGSGGGTWLQRERAPTAQSLEYRHQLSARRTTNATGRRRVRQPRLCRAWQIITHLTDIDASASASLGEIRIVAKDSVVELAEQLLSALREYRDRWSVHSLEARRAAASSVKSRPPDANWLGRALESDETFVTAASLLADWSRSIAWQPGGSPSVTVEHTPPPRSPTSDPMSRNQRASAGRLVTYGAYGTDLAGHGALAVGGGVEQQGRR